jgi:hypothetical protein
MSDTPVSHWKLGETGQATDRKGVQNLLAVNGPVAAAASLVVNDTSNANAMETGQRFEMPTATNIGLPYSTTAWTMEAWVKQFAIDLIQDRYVCFRILSNQGIGTFGGSSSRLAWSLDTTVVSSPNTALGKTHHLVHTFDSGTWIRYLDGVEVSRSTGVTTPSAPDRVPAVGGREGSPTRSFPGPIDEVAYYNTALTPERILAHYRTGLRFEIGSSGSSTESTVYTDSRTATVSVIGTGFETNTPYDAVLDEDNPVSHWKLGDPNTAIDRKQTLNLPVGSGTIAVSAGIVANNGAGQANRFTKVSGQNFSTGSTNGVPYDTPMWSVEAWIKLTSLGGRISSRGLRDFRVHASGSLILWGKEAGGTDIQAITSGGVIAVGEIYHVVGVSDGTTLRLYVNGVQQTSITKIGDFSEPTATPRISNGTDGVDGTIDEVAWYNTALTPARILAHYQAGVATSYDAVIDADTPVSHWKMGWNTTKAVDRARRQLNLAAQNPPIAISDKGIVYQSDNDRANTFVTGSSQRFRNPGSGAVDADGTLYDTANLSVEAWIKPSATVLPPSSYGIVRRNISLVSLNVSTLGKPSFEFTDPSVATKRASGLTSVAAGVAYHLVGTYDGATLILYVNGAEVARLASATGIRSDPTLYPEIGYHGGAYWDGDIDEVAWYDTALSPARVRAHFLAGLAGYITVGGTGTETNVYNDSRTGTCTVSGTGVASHTYDDSVLIAVNETSRHYDGINDVAIVGAPTYFNSDHTIVAVVKRDVVNTYAGMFSIGSNANNPHIVFEFMPDGIEYAQEEAYASHVYNRRSEWQTTEWQLVACSVVYPGGGASPVVRFHQFAGTSWLHANNTSAVGSLPSTGAFNWDTSGSPQLRFGNWNSSFNWFNGKIAVEALWVGSALSDVQIEALAGGSKENWATAGAAHLWELGMGTPIEDFVGSLDSTAINGTDISSDAPASSIYNLDTTAVSPITASGSGVESYSSENSYANVIAADSPAGYWRHLGLVDGSLPGNGGLGAIDSSGHNAHLPGWNNGGAATTYPKNGSSLVETYSADPSFSFVQDSNVFQYPGNLPVSVAIPASVSVSFWMQASSFASGTHVDLVRKGDQYAVYAEASSGNHVLAAKVYVGGASQILLGPVLNAGQSYHVGMTYDNGVLRLFLDGAQVAERTDLPAAPIGDLGQTLAFAQAASSANAYAGLLDEVAIFDHALTPARILAQYTIGKDSTLGITYTDSGSGTVTASGSDVETYIGSDSSTGTITASGVSSEAWLITDSASGSIVATGTRTDNAVYDDTGTGTVSATGTRADDRVYTDISTGTVVVTGTRFDSSVYDESGTGTVVVTGTRADNSVYTDTGTGTVVVTGTRVDDSVDTDTSTGTIVVTGTSSESSVYTDVSSGTGAITGSGTETKVYTDTGIGTVVVTGTGTDTFTHSAVGTGTAVTTGTGSESLSYTDSVTGTILSNGTSSEAAVHSSSSVGTALTTGTGIESGVYNDVMSGTILASGTGVDSSEVLIGYVDARSGQINASGTGVESQSHSSTTTGSVLTNGASVESQSHTSTATGSTSASGTSVESQSYEDTATGSALVDGTGSETYGIAIVYTDSSEGLVNITGTGVDSVSYSSTVIGTVVSIGIGVDSAVYDNTATGTITLFGSSADSDLYIDSATGVIVVTGTGRESYGVTQPTQPVPVTTIVALNPINVVVWHKMPIRSVVTNATPISVQLRKNAMVKSM